MGGVYSIGQGEIDGYATVILRSEGSGIEAAFAPEAGMLGCSFTHQGEELLHLGGGLDRYVREGKTIGIPLLHPWANRLAGFGYTFAGREVALDRHSPLIQTDPNGLPIHGLLTGSPHWRLIESNADERSAALRADLDFSAHENLLAAFPFPHRLKVEARLESRALTIRTVVSATGDVAVPISFGYHPYLRLPGVGREDWEVELPVRRQLVLDERMIPTGKSEPVSFPREPLGRRSFDDGFAELIPDQPFLVASEERQIEVRFGEGYPFAQVYAPADEQFICFEPMTAPTDALSGDGTNLPTVPPGDTFAADFTISIA